MSTLEDRLLAAHDAGDKPLLVALYQEAAVAAETIDQRAFFLTHAFVFALEIGHQDAPALRAHLIKMGRF